LRSEQKILYIRNSKHTKYNNENILAKSCFLLLIIQIIIIFKYIFCTISNRKSELLNLIDNCCFYTNQKSMFSTTIADKGLARTPIQDWLTGPSIRNQSIYHYSTVLRSSGLKLGVFRISSLLWKTIRTSEAHFIQKLKHYSLILELYFIFQMVLW